MADPESLPLSLLMLDLDDFKGFNDRHGHPAGDALLRGVAMAINTPIRDGDRVYRFGGDEFVIVLPGTDQDAAMQVADRIRAAVAGSDAVTGLAITASIGVACQVARGPPRDGLVGAADAALYSAKASGGK